MLCIIILVLILGIVSVAKADLEPRSWEPVNISPYEQHNQR